MLITSTQILEISCQVHHSNLKNWQLQSEVSHKRNSKCSWLDGIPQKEVILETRLEMRFASAIFGWWDKMAHLAIIIRRRTAISNRISVMNKELRTVREMLLKLFQTLLFLKLAKSFYTKSIRERTPQNCKYGIPQKEVFIFRQDAGISQAAS